MTEFTTDQSVALDSLRSKRNVFLTGAAGVGKSFVFNHYLEEAKRDDPDAYYLSENDIGQRYPILASTGAAAVLIGGRTVHSFFGLGAGQKPRNVIVAEALSNQYVLRRIRAATQIAIDEVSMLGSDTLDAAEEITRGASGNGEPWGGKRIVASGDFLQLPPVSDIRDDSKWAFNSKAWKIGEFDTALLRRVVRTADPDFVAILHKVRRGIYDNDVYEFLLSRIMRQELVYEFDGTVLFPHKAPVDDINTRKLNDIESPLVSVPTEFTGDNRYFGRLEKVMPINSMLLLKEGALVMIRQNHPDMLYVNGSLGIISKISSDFISVSLFSGDNAVLTKSSYEWTDGNGKTLARARNFPLSLAWASTIHKAQGATIDRVCVDLRGAWECGQSYVALSRVRSASNLHVLGWDQSSIRADASVVSFYDNLEYEMNYEGRSKRATG